MAVKPKTFREIAIALSRRRLAKANGLHKSKGKLPPKFPSIPEWAKPLEKVARYKGAYGGRAGGKSHYFAEAIVRRMVADPNLRVVCIREIQKSLRFSVKSLIEKKIRQLGVSDRFEILLTEIRAIGGSGIIIFEGMQAHTADSIKSLEGFSIAWVEEAQNFSERSLSLLRPTIRAPGSEIWFSWNPEQPTDAVDSFFRGGKPPQDAIVVQVNYLDNPHCPAESIAEMELDRDRDTDYYQHVWLGGYNITSELQVLSGKWIVDEFVAGRDWDGPYHGGDWGFATDPTAAIRLWIRDRILFVEFESWAQRLELDDIADKWKVDIPGIAEYVVRADSSRPDTISHVKGKGIPQIVGAKKYPGSVKEGIEFLRNFDRIVVHPRCTRFIEECRLYQWRTNRAGDIIPGDPLDKHNHLMDSTRYALSPLIEAGKSASMTDNYRGAL